MEIPRWEDLPLDKSGPPLNAWGLYGKDDQLGRVNLIDNVAVKRGIAAVTEGIRINLNMPVTLKGVHPQRQDATHFVMLRPQCNDDYVAFNTQGSTQWDGLKHYGYLDWPESGTHTCYNGTTLKKASMISNPHLGIQNLVSHPISTRAHLLDIPRYLERKGLPPLQQFFGKTGVSLEVLQGCTADCGIQFAPGDVLCLRVGHTEALLALPSDEVKEMRHCCEDRGYLEYQGVQPTEQVMKWHWENGFAAVVTDSPAYERMPFPAKDLSLHAVFLAGWGMPIGELFDLRELAETCDRLKKWTFMFTSMPLLIPGGVASPPNAQAIL
ncbi:hypothetical protein I302_100003 [Kwoniella bestiolae CBS 10118]|uniref:Cyclase n=1 Tax=Kwoniella bestiolae CBS 10118 TaxID=1296100 RepID=A0A1B9G3Y0_9TREE|nr:hypothetical protein I302_03375 [Kwoniella bestiolae CBS 10118]OCF25702.1 hypothetical protein I302_03375 [Kwoniella bestiolae CBS 10118]